jgi:hypothetical protein
MKEIHASDLPAPILVFIEATNAFDTEALIAIFTEDALVNPRQREFWGAVMIRKWAEKEWVGERVTMTVTRILEHHGNIIIDARMDGNFNKTGLPGEFILTFYFSLENEKITQLFICGNGPVE